MRLVGFGDVHYGHKLNLTSGKSGMILDVVIEAGNPADAERLLPMLERHIDIYGRPPRQMAADGGYASGGNLKAAKENRKRLLADRSEIEVRHFRRLVDRRVAPPLTTDPDRRS